MLKERVITADNCRSMFETPAGFYYAAGLDLTRRDLQQQANARAIHNKALS